MSDGSDEREVNSSYQELLPLYASLGHAVARWGRLEHMLADWLQGVTGMSAGMANDIFLTPQSFRGRVDTLAVSEAQT